MKGTLKIANSVEAAEALDRVVEETLKRRIERYSMDALYRTYAAIAAAAAGRKEEALAHGLYAARYSKLAKEAAEALENLQRINMEAKKLRDRREALGWSQQQLADRVRCSKARISQIENGDTPSPTLALLLELELESGEKEKDNE